MKSIMMSIQPQWCAKTLNGEKTIEIRTRFPLDYVGWVYMNCTKAKPYLAYENCNYDDFDYPATFVGYCTYPSKWELDNDRDDNSPALNGKVVARFWCDRVDEIYIEQGLLWKHVKGQIETTQNFRLDLLRSSCLTFEELDNYAKPINDKQKVCKAINITKLEIFDTPKELKEFYSISLLRIANQRYYENQSMVQEIERDGKLLNLTLDVEKEEGRPLSRLTKAPQSWCYVEVEE